MGVVSRAPRLAPGPLVPTTVQGRLLFGDGARKEDIKVAVRQIQRTKMPTIGKYFNALGAHDEVAALAHFVDVPTHIYVGSHDRLTPVRYSTMLRDAMPHADLTVLPDLGHMLTYEAPVVLADALISLVDRAQAPAA
jgi:pimeloyl-ACP methyl ester carboxylesterase